MRRIVILLLTLSAAIFFAWLGSFRALPSLPSLVMQRLTFQPLSLPYPPPPSREHWRSMSSAERLADAGQRVLPRLEEQLRLIGQRPGDPVFLRFFKESRECELWLQNGTGAWKLFRTYPIACLSGEPGPKQKEGDGQAPEGFYDVTAPRMHPGSSYHLAFNIGYPNAYDLHHQRTGSLIMVHGGESSIGCYAMTDPVIEEIYLLVSASLQNGQPEVQVHCFPFRFTAARMEKARSGPWFPFWENLNEGCQFFEMRKRLPAITMKDGRYVFS